jgi:pre-60S factor REI1
MDSTTIGTTNTTTACNMDNTTTTDTNTASPKLVCRTCDMSFGTPEEKREHAKSEWHVYKLRCKVAPEGTIIAPPNERPKDDHVESDIASSTYSDEPGLSKDEDPSEADGDVHFIPEQCLFCSETKDSFDNNVAHMRKAHSFIVPYQSSLAVDVETLIWYLHLVIYGYHECIFCAKRHRSEDAVQQHMTAKGHCRLNIEGDVAEFYDGSKTVDGEETSVRLDQSSMRLPSGKVLTHRSHLQSSASPRPHKSPEPHKSQLPSSQHTTELLDMSDKKTASFANQLAQLSANDQQSLAHLPVAEQRSALATMHRQLSQAQRAERRAQIKVEGMGNKTLSKHYRAANSGRLNGKNFLIIALCG